MKRIWVDRVALAKMRATGGERERPIVVEESGAQKTYRRLKILGPSEVVGEHDRPQPLGTVSVWIETDADVEGE